MEQTLLEGRVSAVLKEKKFCDQTENVVLQRLLDDQMGVFIEDYFVMLEVSSVNYSSLHESEKTAINKSGLAQHVPQMIEGQLECLAVYLWIIDVRAGGFLSADQSSLCRKVKVNLSTPSVFAQSASKNSTPHPQSYLCLAKSLGETSIRLINSAVDHRLLSIYTDKQIFVGRISDDVLLRNIDSKAAATTSTTNTVSMLRVQGMINQSSALIVAVKFHKISNVHIAFLTADSYFTVYNLKRSFAFPVVEINLNDNLLVSTISRSSSSTSQKEKNFVDFEFGGSTSFATIENPTTADFDFLAVYFLADDETLFYLAPLVLSDMPLRESLLISLRNYLLQEIAVIENNETNLAKADNMREFFNLMELLQRTSIDSKDTLDNQLLHQSSMQICSQLNTPTLGVVHVNIDMKHITEKLGCEPHLRLITVESPSTTTASDGSAIRKRKAVNLHKVENSECMHVFIVTREATDQKNYVTVQTLISSLGVMPTINSTGTVSHNYRFFEFSLFPSEKARLPVESKKRRTKARLLSNRIETKSLDSVIFAVNSQVFNINFKYLQSQLTASSFAFNFDNSPTSEITVLIESTSTAVTKHPASGNISGGFYAISASVDSRLLFSVVATVAAAAAPLTFSVKCVSVEYLSNYIHVQKSAKIISTHLDALTSAFSNKTTTTTSASGLNMVKSSIIQAPLKTVTQLPNQVDVKAFECEMEKYLVSHEQIVKENVRQIAERHLIVGKKSDELEERKKKVEREIEDVLVKKRDALATAKQKMLTKNQQIYDKLSTVSKLLLQARKNPIKEASTLPKADTNQTEEVELVKSFKQLQSIHEIFLVQRAELLCKLSDETVPQIDSLDELLAAAAFTLKKTNAVLR